VALLDGRILRGIFPTDKVSSGTDVSLNRDVQALRAEAQRLRETLVTRFMCASRNNVTHDREFIRQANEISLASIGVPRIVASQRRRKNACAG
jgi:hypothetical protein